MPFRNPAAGKIPPPCSSSSSDSSVFKESPLSPAEVANNLRDELKRMKRRRQLVPYVDEAATARTTAASSSIIHSAPPGSPEPMMESSSSTCRSKASKADGATTSQSPRVTAKVLVGTKEKPVFTLKQMSIICERMCQERTDKVRQEYDKILQQKLSEQYDAFVKFIDHQIQQRFNQSQLPSYLS